MSRSRQTAGSWQDAIYELAAWGRPSASDGERRAAELIAQRLRALGCTTRIEPERAHGGYWWPIGIANAAPVLGAWLALCRPRRSSRALAALLGVGSATALWDDLGHGSRWFRRAALPHRTTWNVVAQTGEESASRTLVVIAHHDAAHSGLVFHPALGRLGHRLAPKLTERSSHTLPILYAVWLGPVTIGLGAALGARRLMHGGLALSLGAILAMIDIGLHPVVPGANDNLTAVGALLALAEALRARPLRGARVLLLSTGSEESFSEGMQAFLERHAAELPRERTEMLCLECLGGPHLNVLEGEGMLRMRDYPQRMRDALAAAAARVQVPIGRGLRTVAATDALFALRAGYDVVTLASVDDAKLPINYHWPSDVPERLHWTTVQEAIEVCEAFLRMRAERATLVETDSRTTGASNGFS